MKKTKMISVLLVIVMCFMFMGAANPLDSYGNVVSPRYESIYTIEVNISSSGYFIVAESTVLHDSNYNVDLVTAIEESSNGVSWTDSVSSATSSCKCLGSSGKYYRAVVTATVYDDTGAIIEEVTKYSYIMQF